MQLFGWISFLFLGRCLVEQFPVVSKSDSSSSLSSFPCCSTTRVEPSVAFIFFGPCSASCLGEDFSVEFLPRPLDLQVLCFTKSLPAHAQSWLLKFALRQTKC